MKLGKNIQTRVPRAWKLLPLAGLFMAIFAMYVHTQRTFGDDMIGGDGRYSYYWARSIAFDHDLNLENDYRLCGDPFNLRSWRAAPHLAPPNH